MASGPRNKFAVPMVKPKALWEQMYCVEKKLATLLGLFGAWGLCLLAPPRYTPGATLAIFPREKAGMKLNEINTISVILVYSSVFKSAQLVSDQVP